MGILEAYIKLTKWKVGGCGAYIHLLYTYNKHNSAAENIEKKEKNREFMHKMYMFILVTPGNMFPSYRI